MINSPYIIKKWWFVKSTYLLKKGNACWTSRVGGWTSKVSCRVLMPLLPIHRQDLNPKNSPIHNDVFVSENHFGSDSNSDIPSGLINIC